MEYQNPNASPEAKKLRGMLLLAFIIVLAIILRDYFAVILHWFQSMGSGLPG